jgi:membrane-associated phospholipid phosphatase
VIASSSPSFRYLRWFAPRPGEWVLLAFWVFLALVPHPAQRDEGVAIPRFDLILGALELFMVRLAVTWFKTPWRDPKAPLAILYPATAIVMVIPPATLFFETLAQAALLPRGESTGGLGSAGLALVVMVLDRTMVGALPLMLWLALGIHAKRAGALSLDRGAMKGLLFAVDFARDAAVVVLVILGYSSMSTLTQFPLLPDQDHLIQRIDQLLFFGVSPVHALERLITPWLSEWLAFCYVMYVSIVALTMGGMLWSTQRRAMTEFAFVVAATLVTGYVIYPLVPVRGPMYALTFTTSIDQYVGLAASSLDAFRISRDCFPSLHTALSVSLWLLLYRRVRGLAWALLPIVASIPFACVYLRYHYVTDVLAGIGLAVAVDAVARRLFPTQHEAASEDERLVPVQTQQTGG